MSPFFMALPRFLGFLTLGQDINKVEGKELQNADGVVSALTPDLTLDTPDAELIALKKQWIKRWEGPQAKLSEKQKDSEKYWRGKQDDGFFSGSSGHGVTDGLHQHPKIDNLIFESLETYLPQATRKTPEPVVFTDEEGQDLAERVRKMLIYLADILQFRLKLKSVVRNWALYYSGIVKVGWDFIENEITMVVLRPQVMIFDDNATITENGVYTGEYLGEFRKDKASKLVERFPGKKAVITAMVQGQMGTKVQYIEWWADNGRILFWTLKDDVLGKVLNPHWNYPEEVERVNDIGETETESFTPKNHFKTPQIPYTFLSMFNLGLHPYDVTSLIEQNLGNQDKITKRYRQIDRNVDDINGGWAISGEKSGITKEQADSAVEGFRRGDGVWIPEGSIGEAVQHIVAPGLPSDVFNDMQDARSELRGIWGVSGSTPQGTKEEKTVRGKIIVGQQDQSRIGGGISEYLEQFSDRIYNWFVQLMYVYYDEEHIGSVIGRSNATETVVLRNEDLNRDLRISVKEGSMIPKDPLTQANQAIDLFGAGAISPLTLHERLDDPNPQETVKELQQFLSGQQLGGGGGAEGTQPPEQQGSSDLLSSVPLP